MYDLTLAPKDSALQPAAGWNDCDTSLGSMCCMRVWCCMCVGGEYQIRCMGGGGCMCCMGVWCC